MLQQLKQLGSEIRTSVNARRAAVALLAVGSGVTPSCTTYYPAPGYAAPTQGYPPNAPMVGQMPAGYRNPYMDKFLYDTARMARNEAFRRGRINYNDRRNHHHSRYHY